jgi:hypothetical protein
VLARRVEISLDAFEAAEAELGIRGAGSVMRRLIDLVGGFQILTSFAAVDGAGEFEVAESAEKPRRAGGGANEKRSALARTRGALRELVRGSGRDRRDGGGRWLRRHGPWPLG